jgi:hypothetical protein
MVTRAAAESRVELDVEGAHAVLVRAPRRQPYSTMVVLKRGTTVELNANLHPASERTGGSKDYLVDPFH